ncbi:MAG TPA: hypothetical protein VHC71_00985 [Hyphomicrobium sp.]|jgi:hypothetical protein|nr:hypothetical protein [Hyphomicrobium sp.]
MSHPERALVAASMQLIVMRDAERHGVFVRDLERHGARLRETQMVCLCWPTAANQTRLIRDEGKMLSITNALFLRDEIGLSNMSVCVFNKRSTDVACSLFEGIGNSLSDLTMIAAGPLAKVCKRLQVSGPERVNVVEGFESIDLPQGFRSERIVTAKSEFVAVFVDENEIRF